MIRWVRRLSATLVFIHAALPASAAELIMFEQEACEWCEAWDRDIGVIYTKTSEGQRLPLRRVDIFEDRPEDLRSLSGVRFTPTFVVMDDGHEIGRINGYPGEDFFWSLLGELLEKLDAAAKQRAATN